MRTSQENPQGYESSSVIRLAKNLHGHLLIAYRSYDDNVHPIHEMAFVDALVAAAKKFEMMVYRMRKHGITDEAAILHLYPTMPDFWKASLSESDTFLRQKTRMPRINFNPIQITPISHR